MITARDRTRNCSRGITAQAVGYEPLAVEQELSRHLCAIPFHRAHDARLALQFLCHDFFSCEDNGRRRFGLRRGFFSRTNRKAIAASAGSNHRSSVTTGACFVPPYRGDSLVQSVLHSKPSGGASNGSGAGLRSCRSPRFTTSKRSSFFSAKKRKTKLEAPSTAPSTLSDSCSRKRESSRRSFKRST